MLGVVGFLLYEALQPQTAAEIVAEVKAVTPQAGGYLVDFVATNHGRQTAASVTIEGAFYDPAQADEPVETAEVTLDYIPDQSDRTGRSYSSTTRGSTRYGCRSKAFMDP